jgi:hypothetical protein
MRAGLSGAHGSKHEANLTVPFDNVPESLTGEFKMRHPGYADRLYAAPPGLANKRKVDGL